MSASVEIAPGAVHYPGYLDRAAQEALRDDLREIVRAAPLFQPRMPRTGKAFSVRMTNCGPLGWVSDERGYRYQPQHPDTGAPWPAMPEIVAAGLGGIGAGRAGGGSLSRQFLRCRGAHGPASGS